MNNTNFHDVELFLETPENLTDEVADSFISILRSKKNEAVINNEQESAKYIWCLENTLNAHMLFHKAFEELKSSQFYSSWCTFEQAEITLHFLKRHFFPQWENYKLGFIQEQVANWQSIFPYSMFFSPEFIIHEKKCTICQRVVSIRNSCGHKVGEIYNGELCGREISKVDVVGNSFVKTPVQKYSVVFPIDPNGQNSDPFSYEIVKYVMSGLESPYHGWDYQWSKRRQPHAYFTDISEEDSCPCESTKPYKECCQQEIGVLRPHLDIIFRVPPLDPSKLKCQYYE